MNTAEYIIKRLEELGVNEFFGLPGDYNLNLLYAVENNPNTKWIGCTNELNAGYAADGYARVRGYGALITTYGVGELSAMNAIAGSMAENVPVIHLVGMPTSKNIEGKALLHHNLQDADYQCFMNAFQQVTSTATILTRDNAKIEVDRAIKLLIKEKKPVYIAIPSDIAVMSISDRDVSYDWISDKEVLNEAALKIASRINNSEKPVIIGDCLIKRFEARIEYKEFVEKSGIPVSNFLMGTNLVDPDYENYIGTYFGKFRNPIAQKYIEETDCLIAVGPIYSDLNSFGQNLPFDINSHIAIYGTYTYIGNEKYDNIKMADVLEAVTKMIETKDIEIDRPNIGLKPKETLNEQLTSSYIYPRIQEFLKDNDIIFIETGSAPYGAAQIKYPANSEVVSQILWGSIGWATPAALGAAIAKPQSRVVLITGEGSHQLTALEIGTMLRYGVKPIVIVINNKGYTVERLISENSNDKFNDITQMNYAKFARVFEGDIWATKVSTSEDFDKALKVTQIMNKLCYIEACTDSLDTPQLTKELVNELKLKAQSTQVHKKKTKSNKNDKNDIEKLILTNQSSNVEYETVVHKKYSEKTDEEEEE